jgi:hypothetical protein
MKPLVLIGVEGGVADYEVFPTEEDANVLLIDWDNLEVGPIEDVRAMLARVIAEVPDTFTFKRDMIDDLEGIIESSNPTEEVRGEVEGTTTE